MERHARAGNDALDERVMSRATWRSLRPFYLLYVLAFPLGMLWVETRALHMPPVCIFRVLAHAECPSCGMTRAFHAMGRLDVVQAFGYNPLGPVVFLAAAIFWGFFLLLLLTNGRARIPAWWLRWRMPLFWTMLALYLALGAYRMTRVMNPQLSLPGRRAPVTEFYREG